MTNFRIIPATIVCDCGAKCELDAVTCPKGHHISINQRYNLFCPNCQEERVIRIQLKKTPPVPKNDRFCGICGHDFESNSN